MQMITVLVLALALYGSTVQGMTKELRDFALKLHNDYRKNVPGACQMERMEYDMELERQATEWANKCVFKHEIVKGRGENLAWNTAKDPETDLMTNAAKAWYDEVNMYSYGQYSCRASCHYTQMVWDRTNKVGCATKRCSFLVNAFADAWYFVCFYSPAGNMNGEKPYQKSCTSPCKEGQTEDADGLCVGSGAETVSDEAKEESGANEESEEEPEGGKVEETHEEIEEEPESGEDAETEGEHEGEHETGTEEETEGEHEGEHETGREEETEGEHEGEHETGTEEETEEVCEDKDSRCEGWAKVGECTKNPSYMHRDCRLACALCGDECKDVHRNCAAWAADSQCTKNPSYMNQYCKLSCSAC